MKISKKIVIEVSVIGAMLLILVFRLFGGNKQGLGLYTAKSELLKTFLPDGGIEAMIKSVEKNLLKPDGVIRDPFMKPGEVLALERSGLIASGETKKRAVGAKNDTEGLVLEGVIWGGSRNMAIISGGVYSTGDSVHNGKITRIDDQGVEIKFKDKTLRLKTKK